MTPSTLSFGNQVINQSSVAISATLKNNQAAPLSISSIAMNGGTAPADFLAGGNCPLSPSTLGPGENCRITVTFTPSALGLRTATLAVADNARTTPLTVSLTGIGVAPVDGSPSSSNSGAVAVRLTSATPSGTLPNNKNGAPTSSVIASNEDFARGRPGAPKLPSRVSGGPTVIAPGGAGNATGLVSLVVTPVNPSIAAGSTQQFTATGVFGDGVSANLTASVAWYSSTPGVATINAAGLATSMAPGSTIIIATYASATTPPVGVTKGGPTGAPPIIVSSPSALSGSTTLTVTPAALVSIAVTPANPSIAAGTTQQFTATGTYSDGSTQNLTSTATWSSSAPGVATISTTGLASALAVGQTTITAAGGAISGSTTLTVTAGFVMTGNLNTGRYSQTATLLDNGLVLMAGGMTFGDGGYLASAELYDPTAGTFALTGNLNTARYIHTATLLNNGLVLIAGGTGSSGTLASAELYNPAAGTFSPTGSLNNARYGHTATLLPGGLVLIAGGVGAAGPESSAELYNPTTGTFTPTGSLNTARYYHTATLLNNGLVLIAGGGGPLANAELYSPTTGTFTPTGSLNTARGNHTATLLNNGTVLVAGGLGSGNAYLANVELYDPALGVFNASASLSVPRFRHTATLLNNGQVLVAGGYNSSGALASAELYNPASETFTLTGSMSNSRYWDTATLLDDGQVLLAGGLGPSYASAELYDPATLTPPNLVSVSLSPNSPTIPLGSALRFSTFGTFSGGTTEQLAEVTWNSSNPEVISISDDASNAGAAYAAAAGSATVSACAGAVCGSTTVTVPPGLVSIAVTPAKQAVAPGLAVQFSAAGTFDDGSTRDITSSVTWSSSVLSVATIDTGGLATALRVYAKITIHP